MRAGPLSSPRVIDLLNARFVPVFAVNEDYGDDGPAPDAEKAAYRSIYRKALDAGLPAGSVHAYVVDPAGEPIASLHVADAAREDRLIELLKGSLVGRPAPKEAKPVVAPRSLSAPPEAPAGSVVLHLTARGRGGSWDGFPSENWIVLDSGRRAGLLPRGDVRAGTTWEVREDVATAILTHFYPQTENNDVKTHRFERRSLRGEVRAVEDGVARAWLVGDLRMSHAFYPGRDDGKMVEARVVGLLDFDVADGRVRRLRLVTEEGATYGEGGLDVAVRSRP